MNRVLKVALPLAVVIVGAIVAAAMIASREEPETREIEVPTPAVRVESVELRDVQLVVRSQGTVSPRTESVLVPEVSGRVIRVAASFASGGFFEKDEALVEIDAHDYRQVVVQARASVAQAELRLEQERAEAEVAVREWDDLGKGKAPPLTRREPQLAEARASVDAALAALERAERDLERTKVRAPYAGRVRSKEVDVGQFVAKGTPLARVYAVDFAEIRLPLPDDELAYVDLPLVYRGESGRGPSPRVVLSARFAGRTHVWHGRIVRTEGEIDSRSRMIHAVARVKDPYARGDDPDRPPLAAGLFVQAEIEGRRASEVAVLPRTAVRGEDQVLVVSDDGRLHFRPVEILRLTQGEVIVASGLADGERVCVSPLAVVTEGMRVRVAAGAPR
jgi:RND family efflux transporter MFP subunit